MARTKPIATTTAPPPPDFAPVVPADQVMRFAIEFVIAVSEPQIRVGVSINRPFIYPVLGTGIIGDATNFAIRLQSANIDTP
jgi:hypothetical protein